MSGETMGFAGGGHQCACLILAFLVFEFRFAVDDDASTCLNMDLFVLDDGSTERDAGIH